MNLKCLFSTISQVDKMLDGQLLEASVKQHQITFAVSESMLSFPLVQKILSNSYSDESFVSTKDDVLYFSLTDLSLDNVQEIDLLYPFVETISQFAHKICTCPSLEFIISPQYLKCFLDKPGLTVSNLSEYEEILGVEGKGELVLHPQRPYLLFINEYFEIKE